MSAQRATIEFRIVGEFITLDNLLKVTGVAASGGAAKALAAAGAVTVNGQVELRKTCKIRAGQVVETADARIRVLASEAQVVPPPH
jgi:ribosome-associated protein